jgi:LysW-gamma-L-lysine carboxypeptidase
MNDAQALDLLEALVSIPSRSGHERDAVEFLVGEMSRHGFDAHVDPVGNAVGTLGTSGPRICLLGHIDTVAGDVAVRREGGKLYGRGAVDAKGSLCAFVAASARAAASGSLKARVEIVGCVEEEATSSKGARYRATLDAPDACIVGEPSRWDGLTLGYKGYLQVRCSFTESLAHTASDRTSAAARACRAFSVLEGEIERFNDGRETLFDRLLLHLDAVSSESDGLSEHTHLDLKLRLPPDWMPAAAEAWLRELVPAERFRFRGAIPAWSGPRSALLARHLARAIARTGGRARFQQKTGTADLNIVAPAWNCPALAYGPGDSSLDHTPDEYISFEEFERGMAVLTEFLCHGRLEELANPRGLALGAM